jgi:hypothetical protein
MTLETQQYYASAIQRSGRILVVDLTPPLAFPTLSLPVWRIHWFNILEVKECYYETTLASPRLVPFPHSPEQSIRLNLVF